MDDVRVLLVEDDPRISEPLIRVLRAETYDVVHVDAGQPALDSVAGRVPDLVLLDLTLPDIDGLDVCRRLRADHLALPIIMLTARAEEVDVIVGLGAGADDYVAKPFRLAELMARIAARLRVAGQSSTAAPTPDAVLTGAGIELHPSSRRCFVTDRHDGAVDAVGNDLTITTEVELTSKEFDLLELLMRRASITIKRDDIMAAVWDENWWGSTRTLDTHASTLRRKILDRSDPPSKIVTVRGVGFRFDPGTSTDDPSDAASESTSGSLAGSLTTNKA